VNLVYSIYNSTEDALRKNNYGKSSSGNYQLTEGIDPVIRSHLQIEIKTFKICLRMKTNWSRLSKKKRKRRRQNKHRHYIKTSYRNLLAQGCIEIGVRQQKQNMMVVL
jgi:hypothetical protein